MARVHRRNRRVSAVAIISAATAIGPALLVLPERQTPLEAYRAIRQAGKAPAGKDQAGDIFGDRRNRQSPSSDR